MADADSSSHRAPSHATAAVRDDVSSCSSHAALLPGEDSSCQRHDREEAQPSSWRDPKNLLSSHGEDDHAAIDGMSSSQAASSNPAEPQCNATQLASSQLSLNRPCTAPAAVQHTEELSSESRSPTAPAPIQCTEAIGSDCNSPAVMIDVEHAQEPCSGMLSPQDELSRLPKSTPPAAIVRDEEGDMGLPTAKAHPNTEEAADSLPCAASAHSKALCSAEFVTPHDNPQGAATPSEHLPSPEAAEGAMRSADASETGADRASGSATRGPMGACSSAEAPAMEAMPDGCNIGREAAEGSTAPSFSSGDDGSGYACSSSSGSARGELDEQSKSESSTQNSEPYSGLPALMQEVLNSLQLSNRLRASSGELMPAMQNLHTPPSAVQPGADSVLIARMCSQCAVKSH